MRPDRPEKVGLPVITFLYTLDQIAAMLGVDQAALETKYIYYHLRSTGRQLPQLMRARNIALPDSSPDWRVPQMEFVRWLRVMGIHVESSGRVT